MKIATRFLSLSWIVCVLCMACTGSNNIRPRESFSCTDMPKLEPNLPFDVNIPNHPNTQCFAWQQFIALNWPALAGSPGVPDRARNSRTWGDPNDSQPMVWETYKEAHEVFLPAGAEPGPWGSSDLMRSFDGPMKMSSALDSLTQGSGTHVFRMTSKVSSRLRRTDQAFGGWLTGQNRRLTYYGIHMNRVTFDYIVANRFYDAKRQAGQLINLPPGRTGGGELPAEEGAIEVKSAWLDLTGIPEAKRKRFKTTKACVVEGSDCRWVTVGLVGLHIVHKTETFPQWSWATFEHVDNAPDVEDIRQGSLRRSYTYHDPSCSAADCPPNTRTSTDRTVPIQVVRSTPIAADAQALNQIVREKIRRQNRDSVWQYYQLVDVQWPEAGATISTIQDIPLPQGGPRPTSIANATLETYVQRQTCIDCHRGASIASGSQASDYSFLFGLATESP